MHWPLTRGSPSGPESRTLSRSKPDETLAAGRRRRRALARGRGPGAGNRGRPAKPDLAKAQTIVNQVCAACHGADGNSPSPANPNLAGLPAEYITAAIGALQERHPRESGDAGHVGDALAADMAALGAYFAQQKPKGLDAKDPELVKVGQALYRGGDAATRRPGLRRVPRPQRRRHSRRTTRGSPGQHGDYTYAQLKAFKAGERGADKDGKDVNGRIMAAVAAKLTDAQMKALAEYTTGLR